MTPSPTHPAMRGPRRLRAALLALPLASLAVALPQAGRTATPALTLYSAQHEQVVDMITKAFTQATGIPVRDHSGEAPEIASQIVAEGDASPADVFFTENSPELMLLGEKGKLTKVAPSTLAQVPARYSAPNGEWVGVLARENVLAYDPRLIRRSALPASLLDLARPEWKGKVAIAPTDADFLPLVDAVASLKGHDAALTWLRGLKANAQVFDDDEGVVAAVDRGAVATGIINSYYWARLRAEQGPARTTALIHHFGGGDLGALLNVSGAAALKSSKHPAEAQRFLAFLVSAKVQRMLGQSDVDFEYPLAAGVPANGLLRPMDELQPPSISMTQLGDDTVAATLLREAGLI